MLWNIIRDFFVVYIWGGLTSTNVVYNGIVAKSFFDVNGSIGTSNTLVSSTATYLFPISIKLANGQTNVDYFISLGDWLSTTSTIIVLILMCVFLYVFIRWAFRLTAGLFQGR